MDLVLDKLSNLNRKFPFCFLKGDRYDSEPRGTDQFDEFNGKEMRKSKIREWRERAGSYGEYKDKERYLT